ncbi:MAG: hypothetical protein H6722_08675 [Sandaracinus sp.]|nr:hypothetical protein [Sandaracinus sp.]
MSIGFGASQAADEATYVARAEAPRTETAAMASPRPTTTTNEGQAETVRSRRATDAVFRCLPAELTQLQTRVVARAGNVTSVTIVGTRLDEDAERCVRQAILGTPLDRATALLRWQRP